MSILPVMDLALARRASDVHLAPGRSPAFRIDGSLCPQVDDFEPLTVEDCEEMIFSVLRPDQRSALDKDLEIDLGYEVGLASGPTRFRINVHRQRRGLSATFRVIRSDIPSPEELGLERSLLDFAKLPRGLVLFTGATGSGKSTTMACLIEQINQSCPKHIVSIEDPIEYTYSEKRSCITQRELGAHTRGFSPALRSALREDPDVILIGEMRDLETIQLALTASETGHLVFSTLHTTDASQTVDRVVDVFPPAQQALVRSQLASVLQGVVTQALLPRASSEGRIAAREILVANAATRTLIREGNTHQIYSSLVAGLETGMCPLELSLAVKVKQNLIAEEEAFKAANRQSVLRDYLGSQSISGRVPRLSPAGSLEGGGEELEGFPESQSPFRQSPRKGEYL